MSLLWWPILPSGCLRCASTGYLDHYIRRVMVLWRCPACSPKQMVFYF